ncbi:MAG: hypothetical protein RR202_10470 [Bacteroidales bacterium]
MYYKIENQDSELYKALRTQREKEIENDKRNMELIAEKIPQEWEGFFGRAGQQTFNRTSVYRGFKFNNPNDLPNGIWVEKKGNPGIYIPNKRTKGGKEMAEFLDDLGGFRFTLIFEILGLGYPQGTFSFPYVELIGDTVLIHLDDIFELKHEGLKEITRTEFYSILNKE